MQPQAGQSNWQPKARYNVAKPTGQQAEFFDWNAKSATVGGVTVQGVQRGMGAQQPKTVVSQGRRKLKSRRIYAPGDHVLHKKFGRGAGVRVGGSADRNAANYDSL